MPESTGINQERLALGTAALRSGNYPQAKGVLREAGGYCCLGVLTEVAIANGLQLAAEYNPAAGCWEYEDDLNTGVLPRKVADWYGFGATRRNPRLRYNGVNTTAVGANDSIGLDFNEIADAFDATYGTKGDDSDV